MLKMLLIPLHRVFTGDSLRGFGGGSFVVLR